MNESSFPRIAVLAAVALIGLGGKTAGGDRERQAEAWADRCPDADRVLLDAAGVAAFNRRLLAIDASLRDLAALPATLAAAEVASLLHGCSRLPEHPLSRGDAGSPDSAAGPADRDRWIAALGMDSIPNPVRPRFALVTRRAALRRFPTAERVRRPGGPADIDLFQESAFFPGTPVAAVHATADDRWSFVLGTTYAAWIDSAALAFTDRDTALDFARRSTLVVTAAQATAVPLGVGPTAAEVVLDMGTALPAGTVGEAGGRSVELPVRSAGGTLALAAARVEPADALSEGPLPATRRQLLRQAFRFLGEPYGWGHDHGARDCSGFVCEVYRSLGLLLPRNTRDQAVSPALDRTIVPRDWPRDRRLAALGRLEPGDLVSVPGHVMMVVGHDAAGPWVIHDTHAGRLAGETAPTHGVVVAPLDRMLDDHDGSVVDKVTVLIRVLPSSVEPLP
jgi:cell wall-associated NlpC family hydrolase